jgi:aspartyl aminopeptidase
MQSDQDPVGLARDLLRFIEASPSPYHAVAESARRLRGAGFERLDEGELWDVQPGTRAYIARGGALIAFILGASPPARAGFSIIGAHTDSPCLRLKPSFALEQAGYDQLAVEVYGSPLYSTWLDRDLGIAGRLLLADGSEALVSSNAAVCRIPNLAIHLNRDANKDAAALNAQQHLLPVLGMQRPDAEALPERLLKMLGGTHAAGIGAKDVLAFDLALYDTQAPAIGGANDELLFSARLDNLASCHAAIRALLDSSVEVAKTRVIALFDHEEVGSQSATGARSLLLENVLTRLARDYPDAGAAASERAMARSWLVSADMAHGVHPNYSDKHDRQHRPLLGAGPVVKVNVNQSYATDGPAAAAWVRASRALDLSPQYFASRNDMPCGSTIGPITAARLGIGAIDVGNPMLSMHSCREMAAVADVAPMIRILSHLFSD